MLSLRAHGPGLVRAKPVGEPARADTAELLCAATVHSAIVPPSLAELSTPVPLVVRAQVVERRREGRDLLVVTACQGFGPVNEGRGDGVVTRVDPG